MTKHLLLLPVLAGCSSNGVHGKVGGFDVEIQSAFLIYDAPPEGSDGLAIVAMSSMPSACAAYRYWYDEVLKAESSDDLAKAWATAFPEQFWEVLVEVVNDGSSWPVSGSEWQGLGVQENPAAGRLSAELIQHNAHRPAEWFDGLQGYENHYSSNAGFAKWRKAVPGEHLSGVFSTSTVDPDGVPTGQVKIEFNATPCPNLRVDAVFSETPAEATDTGAVEE
ncbi:MAG: hypothetical protein ABMA64_34405 [Myxococcota bacterium]